MSGDVIAEITTEKITYELESQAEGVLLKIILPEDEEAPVGAPIAVIGQPGEDVSALRRRPVGRRRRRHRLRRRDAGSWPAEAAGRAAVRVTRASG